MRLFLAAGLCCVSFSAHAMIEVNDQASILVQAKALAQEAKGYLVQAHQYALQVQQYQQEVQTYLSFVHDPSLGAAMGLMGRTGLSNSLPVNPMQVMSLANGYNSLNSLGGILGKLSQLNGLVNTNYTANHIYSPTDGSWNSQQLVANGTAIAGTQGAAQSAYEDLRNHLPIIAALRDRLATATTPKDVQDAQAALESETAWTQNLQTEISTIQINYQVQNDARVQRDNESISQSFDQFHEKASALAWPQ